MGCRRRREDVAGMRHDDALYVGCRFLVGVRSGSRCLEVVFLRLFEILDDLCAERVFIGGIELSRDGHRSYGGRFRVLPPKCCCSCHKPSNDYQFQMIFHLLANISVFRDKCQALTSGCSARKASRAWPPSIEGEKAVSRWKRISLPNVLSMSRSVLSTQMSPARPQMSTSVMLCS